MLDDATKFERKVETLRLLYRNKGVELSEAEAAALARELDRRGFFTPSVVVRLMLITVAVVFLIWRFWHC